MNYSIGQIAKQVGVSEETLRRWEANGLIPSAKRKYIVKWRVWTNEDLEFIGQYIADRSG